MVESVTNELLLEHMKSIQTRLGHLEEGQGRIERRLSSVEDHLATLIKSHRGLTFDLDQLR